MRLGRAVIAVIATGAVLSGCAQQSEGSVDAASSTARAHEPGVGAFLEFARTSGFIKAPNAGDKTPTDVQSRDADTLMLKIGNAVCEIAAEPATAYGQIVADVLEHALELGDDAETYDVRAQYERAGIAIDDKLTFRHAEDLVRASVPNLCPTYAAKVPTPATT